MQVFLFKIWHGVPPHESYQTRCPELAGIQVGFLFIESRTYVVSRVRARRWSISLIKAAGLTQYRGHLCHCMCKYMQQKTVL